MTNSNSNSNSKAKRGGTLKTLILLFFAGIFPATSHAQSDCLLVGDVISIESKQNPEKYLNINKWANEVNAKLDHVNISARFLIRPPVGLSNRPMNVQAGSKIPKIRIGQFTNCVGTNNLTYALRISRGQDIAASASGNRLLGIADDLDNINWMLANPVDQHSFDDGIFFDSSGKAEVMLFSTGELKFLSVDSQGKVSFSAASAPKTTWVIRRLPKSDFIYTKIGVSEEYHGTYPCEAGGRWDGANCFIARDKTIGATTMHISPTEDMRYTSPSTSASTPYCWMGKLINIGSGPACELPQVSEGRDYFTYGNKFYAKPKAQLCSNRSYVASANGASPHAAREASKVAWEALVDANYASHPLKGSTWDNAASEEMTFSTIAGGGFSFEASARACKPW